MEYGRSTRSRDFRAVLPFTRKYTKTKFEGVFFRQSAKRDPRTGEYDKIYCFWYADHEGKGHWKTVGRHSKGVRPATVRKERAKFLAEFDATGINPIERDKVTIGEIVNAYLAWGRSEGKYVDQHYSQYCANPKAKTHALPIADLTPNLLSSLKAQLLKTPTGNTKPKKATKRPKAKAPTRKMLAGQTVNNIFSFMRSAINRAGTTGMWSGVNPLSTKGGTWKMVKANNERLRFLTREEVRALLDGLEKRHRGLCHQIQAEAEHGDNAREDEGQLLADADGHDARENQHHRRAHSHTGQHHKRLLDVCNVGGQTRDERGRREPVDIREREVLHLIIEVFAKVSCEACRRRCAEPA